MYTRILSTPHIVLKGDFVVYAQGQHDETSAEFTGCFRIRSSLFIVPGDSKGVVEALDQSNMFFVVVGDGVGIGRLRRNEGGCDASSVTRLVSGSQNGVEFMKDGQVRGQSSKHLDY